MPTETTIHCDSCGSVLIVCCGCGKTFPRDHRMSRWGKRIYCELACAQANRQLVRFPEEGRARKPCGYQLCDKEAVQRRGEGPETFEKRKYCSGTCSSMARRQPHRDGKRRSERLARQAAEAAGLPAPETVNTPIPENTVVPDPPPPAARSTARPAARTRPTPKPAPKRERPPQPEGMWRPAFWVERDKQANPA